ncbi:MAG: heavy metal translocating P-type ATPase, partial [Candidatus Micrarchaeota archaeon]
MTNKEFEVRGMHCASCAANIEKKLRKLEGVQSASVNFATRNAVVEGTASNEKIKQTITSMGYTLIEKTIETEKQSEKIEEKEIQNYKIKVAIGTIFAIPLLILAMGELVGITFPEIIIANMFYIQFLLCLPPMYAGREFFLRGAQGIINKMPTMDTLVGIGVGAAFLYSLAVTFAGIGGEPYYEIAAVVATFILLGRFLEARARGRASDAIKKLMGLSPKTALVIRNKKEITIPILEVVVEDLVIVKPGEKIPVDGVIVNGESTIDESMVTGESMPVTKHKGDAVIAGTINKHGSITFKATKVGSDTLLSQIIKLVEQAQNSKPPIQKLVDQLSAVFVPVVVLIAVAVFAYWY